jgi:putative acetyltransferase
LNGWWPKGWRFFVLRIDGQPAGCGGIKLFGSELGELEFGELKRMYVRPQFRGREFGKLILDRLDDHARENGINLLRLETGIHQQAAIRLYEKNGFHCIPQFGPYLNSALSLCFEKRIDAQQS